MKNVKYKINFLIQRKKILYHMMDCVEDNIWHRLNTNLFLLIRETKSPVCKEVLDNFKKQIR